MRKKQKVDDTVPIEAATTEALVSEETEEVVEPESVEPPDPDAAEFAPTSLMRLKFCEHYVRTGNARESARLAGYRGRDATLDAVARRLLKREDVGALLAEHLRKLLSPEEANSVLADIARSSIGHFVTFNKKTGQIRGFNFATEQAQAHLHTIKKLKVRTDGSVEIELYDKLGAISLALRSARGGDPADEKRRAVEAFFKMLPPAVRDRVLQLISEGFTEPVIDGDNPPVDPTALPAAAGDDPQALSWLTELTASSAAESDAEDDEAGGDETEDE